MFWSPLKMNVRDKIPWLTPREKFILLCTTSNIPLSCYARHQREHFPANHFFFFFYYASSSASDVDIFSRQKLGSWLASSVSPSPFKTLRTFSIPKKSHRHPSLGPLQTLAFTPFFVLLPPALHHSSGAVTPCFLRRQQWPSNCQIQLPVYSPSLMAL